MLIAIMGDAFERATEQRENNARLTKLRIMGDYIDLIDKSDSLERSTDSQDFNWGLIRIYGDDADSIPDASI